MTLGIGGRDTQQQTLFVVSPWGASGGYSGPLTLMARLFGEVARQFDVSLVLIYRDRGIDSPPSWATRSIAVGRRGRVVFGLVDQLIWAFAVRRALRVLSRHGDVVHLHGAYLPNILGASAKRAAYSTVFLPVLEGGDLRITGSRAIKWLKRRLLKRFVASADLGLALTRGIAAEMEQLGLPTDRVLMFPNVVDTELFVPGSRTTPAEKREWRLGFIGKLGPIKQPHLILEAMAALRSLGVHTRAVFVGPFADSSYEQYFNSRIEDLQLRSRVSARGFVADVSEILRDEIDILVLPSRSEGLPGALVEAMASGLPLVVTAAGSMADIVSAAGCGVVVSDDVAELTDGIALVATWPTWKAMSEAARAYAEANFSSSSAARMYGERQLLTRRFTPGALGDAD